MSNDKNRPAKSASAAAPSAGTTPATGPVDVTAAGLAAKNPIFRRVDWLTFGITTAVTLIAYLFTIAPDLTLEDSGELAVGSYYLGVPHAPGYPVWTVYTWLFTVLIPFSNVAFRVAVSSAVAAAVANGLLGLIVSRGSSMLLESVPDLKNIKRVWEDELCLVSGFVAAIMIGFNGFMWSQAVIVEVYTLSVLSYVGVLVCLFCWTFRPGNYRYLYIGGFLFGICFNNHQTLIVAAMGLEVLIALVRPSLGRNALMVNSIFYLLGVVAIAMGVLTSFDQNRPLLVIFHAVGLASLAGFAYLLNFTGKLKDEWPPVIWTFVAWIAGASFYFLMPVFSSTNPPMNWGYPRTWDGFIHAFTRGQYEKTNPTNILEEPLKFVQQIWMYFQGAAEEFHPVFLVLAVVPFLFYRFLGRRERAWVIGNTAIYLCLAFLLLILLNPTTDRQSRDLTKVFFAASHVTIAMFLGFGLTLIGAMLMTHYERMRSWALYGGAIAVALGLYWLAAEVQQIHSDAAAGITGLGAFFSGLGSTLANLYFTGPVYTILAAGFVLLLVIGFVAVVLSHRTEVRPAYVLGFFAAIPLFSVVSHWAQNEQRGHLFGFWFGHDMFSPPFEQYPEMTKDAVLFGGTDPGRFCPTYMIFAESFVDPEDRRDPKFDRRDVYIITQNALADATYLNYIRAHYHRSTQEDPPFLRDMVHWAQNLAMSQKDRKKKLEGQWHRTNTLAKVVGSLTNVVRPFDNALLAFGKRVEDRRRKEGVYPRNEIYCPSAEDLNTCYYQYIQDVVRRRTHDETYPNEPKQLKYGENVIVTPDGRAQVTGQVAVMAINALLTKVIFDKNPTNEFFVEESFPLEWMFPHLTPFGIIMKINRNPVPEITEEIVRRDHEFWTQYSERLCGNWITYDTPVQEICAFAERVYRRGNLTGYKGDPKFVRDSDAQKSFSKLRNAIAGMYAWRLGPECPPELRPKTTAESDRILREAEFAFKQAFAFCPYSPESLSRFANLLISVNRVDDALALAQTARKFDEEGSYADLLAQQVERMKKSMAGAAQAQGLVSQMETDYRTRSNDLQLAFNLVGNYLAFQRSNDAFRILDDLVARADADATTLLSVAKAYVELNQYPRTEAALRKLVVLIPDTPELWYDLAGAQVANGLPNEALRSLAEAIQLSQKRLATDPVATNLQSLAAADARFVGLRANPEFLKLVAPK